tara:strand:- start:524 stop:877 length:354 start_codon:yes stop_codon:yes gene_type:complete
MPKIPPSSRPEPPTPSSNSKSRTVRTLRGSTQMVFINERSEAFNSSIDLSKGLTIGDIREIGKLGIDIMTGNREEVRSDNLLVFVEPSNKLDLSNLKEDTKVLVIHADAFRAWNPSQ